MARIVNIILRQDIEENWVFGVVRDDNYAEITEDKVEKIQEQIKALVDFANGVKTEEQKALEEAKKREEEALKVIYEKTTLEERLGMINILKRWEEGEEVKKGDERTYNGTLYIAQKNHTCNFETIPVNDRDNWKKAIPDKELPEVYNHETKYQINDKCIFNGHIWSSLVVQEGQSPVASPQTWEDEGEI